MRIRDFSRIAFIGAGGKTTLSTALARAFAVEEGRVALTTTTHFFRPDALSCLILPTIREIEDAWRTHSLIAVCGGAVDSSHAKSFCKMCAPENETLEYLFSRSARLIMEADGARNLLLKLHGANEPVVPLGTELVLIVAGMQALGQPLGAVCHRAERIPSVLHKEPTEITTCRDIADIIGAVDTSAFPHVTAVLNRVTDEKSARSVQDGLREKYGMNSILLPEIPMDAEREATLGALLMQR